MKLIQPTYGTTGLPLGIGDFVDGREVVVCGFEPTSPPAGVIVT